MGERVREVWVDVPRHEQGVEILFLLLYLVVKCRLSRQTSGDKVTSPLGRDPVRGVGRLLEEVLVCLKTTRGSTVLGVGLGP